MQFESRVFEVAGLYVPAGHAITEFSNSKISARFRQSVEGLMR
jgi:hypothetical protein